MAFPTVIASGKGGASSGTGNVVLTLPGSPAAGDLCIIAAGISIISGTVAATGWTNLANINSVSSGSLSQTTSVMYRVIDGSESGICTIPRASSCYLAAAMYLISASSWHGTSAPEAPAPVTAGGGSSPNPPSVTPSWGSADNLFICGYFYKNTSTTGQPSAYPTNYTDNQLDGATASSYGHAVICSRNLTGSSDDPSAFSNGSAGGQAYSIVVRPSAGGGGGGVTLQQVERGRTLGRGLGRGML